MSGQTTAHPLVSIVVATYNGARYIEAQMDSLIAQTYPNTEIVVVDDRSTDNTLEILEKYARRHNNIRVFENVTNLGYIKNFEKGASLAKGEYISFSDQDDIWAPEKTTVLMDNIGDHPMIFSDSELVTDDLQKLWNHSDLKALQTFDNCLCFATDNCVAGHALIMKREIVLAAMPFPDMPHDLWLGFFTTLHGTIKYHDQAFVKWRQHGNNVTGKHRGTKLRLDATRFRLQTFRDACPPQMAKEKKVFAELLESYESYSLVNNFNRMRLFFAHKQYLLAMKKRSEFRKFLFCLKMFFKMREHP
jgi:glycosyltransferase involved in cell wall biosynthesis